MKSGLYYKGEKPVFAMKKDLTSGSFIPLESLYKMFQSRYISSGTEAPFAEWLYANHVEKLGPDFELVVNENDNTENLAADSNMVLVESENLTVSHTMASAEQSLKELSKAKHETSTVSITQDIGGGKDVNKTMRDRIMKLPKPGEIVTTGEDFDLPMEVSPQAKPATNAFILDKHGRSVNAVPTAKEEQRKRDAALANLSGRSKVLTPEVLNSDGSLSTVVTGDNISPTAEEDIPTATPGYKEKVVTKAVVNKNFNPVPTAGSNIRVIKPEDIAHNKDLAESVRLIDMCKDRNTLGLAKLYAQRMGNQSLVERIDRRLRVLPKF